MYSPQITCFADIPVEDLSLHMEKYSRIGLSFSKDFIAQAGGVPVHYIPKEAITKSFKEVFDIDKVFEKLDNNESIEEWYDKESKGKYFDDMLNEFQQIFNILMKNADLFRGIDHNFGKRVKVLRKFLETEIFSYLKFFDHLKADNDPDNFYFEREWRLIGNLNFFESDVKSVFFPKQYHKKFKTVFPDFPGNVQFTG